MSREARSRKGSAARSQPVCGDRVISIEENAHPGPPPDFFLPASSGRLGFNFILARCSRVVFHKFSEAPRLHAHSRASGRVPTGLLVDSLGWANRGAGFREGCQSHTSPTPCPSAALNSKNASGPPGPSAHHGRQDLVRTFELVMDIGHQREVAGNRGHRFPVNPLVKTVVCPPPCYPAIGAVEAILE
jgi:hypothetical protein